MKAVRNVSCGFVVSRITRVVLLAAIAVFVAAPIASASPANTLSTNLAVLWTTVFETPSAQNSFGTGGSAFSCWDLGRTVAPFAPVSVESCTVTVGTKLFVIGSSFECSTFEGNGTTEADLRACARASDVKVAPPISVDGKAVAVTEVETPLLEIVLPTDNLFGLPAGSTGLSVAHGWVTLVQPPTPGTHTIVIGPSGSSISTTIVVETGS
jgi:hypothetical protein